MRRSRPKKPSDGAFLEILSFREAYRDALYALELQEIEEWLKDPEIRAMLRRHTKELLQKMLEKIEP